MAQAKKKQKAPTQAKAAPKKKGKKGRKKRSAWQVRLMLVIGLIMAAIFMPTTVVLFVGMLPTVVALFVDRTKKGNTALTVGSLNLAGCSPFLFDLWTSGHTFEKSIFIISDPVAIIVMYSAATVGYLLDWAMTGIVSGVLYQKGQSKLKALERRQEELIERWGEEVSGNVKLDEQGFPIKSEDDM